MRRPLHVGVLGHWGVNIGHDLMALGVQAILDLALPGRYRAFRIEQHRPMDIYPLWHPLRHVPALRHARGGALTRLVKSYLNRPDVSRRLWRASWVRRLDLGMVSGGPLLRPGFSDGDLGLMYQHMLGAFASHGIPLLNLSLGSAYPYESIAGALLRPADAEFLERMFAYSTVSTVRDELARRLTEPVCPTPLVCDVAFVSGRALAAAGAHDGRTVVLNCQRYGANEDWGQGVDSERWLVTVGELARRLSRRHPVLFVGHSELELQLAREVAPEIPRTHPVTTADYARICAGAVGGICTRIHSGIALSTVGLPVVAVGTDSRLGTLAQLGAPAVYVKEASADLLENLLEERLSRRDVERERLMTLRAETEGRYVELVRGALVA